jgi:hypothetical protein
MSIGRFPGTAPTLEGLANKKAWLLVPTAKPSRARYWPR